MNTTGHMSLQKRSFTKMELATLKVVNSNHILVQEHLN